MSENNEVENEQEQNMDDSDVVTLTLNDVLELEEEIFQESAAILGASSDKVCSYPDGYIKRQALYSCLTCIPESKTDMEKSAGVCLACTYHCHEGHDLVELYTKRNFRCDCGNSKFPNGKCNLYEDKNEINDMNLYNQNFTGVYCTCHKPYPDPEDTISDEMIQCVVCEDWFHTRHLGVEMPKDNFSEMICESCIKDHEFLLHYEEFVCDTEKDTKTDETKDVEVEKVPETAEKESEETPYPGCKKPKTKSDKLTTKFWKDINWRKELCTCDDCLKMYEDEEITFLLDNEDPVHLYEERGKAKAKEVEAESDKTLNSLPRVAVMECIAGYKDLKDNLAAYLKKFAENKTVVREEDIKEFFEGMKANKKARTESYSCR
ncbi:unnamed protein product [Brassicogethes aeneus]|uniref:UBR-type domain-containing protein n=1 Tax=Brassicogethes aeneus TaxID=1431903 RepID=A0A9P0BC60_BRAAE|nr:unnamed protein product [Brassicogethes aeneus]